MIRPQCLEGPENGSCAHPSIPHDLWWQESHSCPAELTHISLTQDRKPHPPSLGSCSVVWSQDSEGQTERTNLLLVSCANPLKAELGMAGQHVLRGAEVKSVCQGVAASLLRPTCKTTD